MSLAECAFEEAEESWGSRVLAATSLVHVGVMGCV